MAPPSYPVSSFGTLFSWISNCTPILCLQLSSTHRFFILCDQAQGSTSFLGFVSDVAVFPDTLLRRTVALTHSAPLREGLTEQWLNAGRTQVSSQDPAAAGAWRLRPGASLPQKKFARECSSSISWIMENHNTRLAPGFTLNDLVPAPANVALFRGLLGPDGFGSLLQMSFQLCNCLSPCGLRTSRTPLCSWDSPFPPEHLQVSSCGVAAFALPLFTVLVEFTYSPFSFLPF